MWEFLSALAKHLKPSKIAIFAVALTYASAFAVPYVRDLFQQLPNRAIIELICILATITSAIYVVQWATEKIKILWAWIRIEERFKELTKGEKAILRRYIEEDTRCIYMRVSSGEINHLEALGIVYRASDLSRARDQFAYNIQPSAYSYLKKNPQILESSVPKVSI